MEDHGGCMGDPLGLWTNWCLVEISEPHFIGPLNLCANFGANVTI